MLRRRRALAAGVVGAALFAPAAAQAASLEVTTTADSGTGSLREALTTADANGQADVITFQPGLTGTITLLSALPTVTEAQDLTITGPGRDVVTISGNDGFRIFNITSGVGKTVTVSGLTLTHGYDAGGGKGGAILDTGGAGLTLSDVAVTSSKSDDRGGGIYTAGTLTLSASTISGNTADNGGGVYAESTGKYSQVARHKISDTTISGNHATSGSGGGISLEIAKLTLERSTVSGNTATSGGGGLSGFPKYGLTVDQSTFTGNSSDSNGGGMSVFAPIKYTPIRVTETTVSGNQSSHGAGLDVAGISPGNPVTIARSTISGNNGGDNSWGGGILFDGGIGGKAQLVDSTVSGNTATAGAGISLGSDHNNYVTQFYSQQDTQGSIDFDNSTIAGNTASAHGGGIYLGEYDSGSPSVKKSASAGVTSTIVAGNTAAGAAQDLDRADTSTAGGFDGAFSLVQVPGDAPLTQHAMLVGIDPQLGALGNNGGPTATMLPAGTSPVIDQGRSDAKLKVDQRNLDRLVDTGIPNASPGGDGTDIGAVELSANQVTLPPPPPKATFDVTVRGKSISPGTPLLPATLLPLDCKVTAVSMTSCSIALRAVKSTKISKKTTIPKGALLAEGVASSGPGVSQLSVKVKLTRDGKDVLKAKPVGVDTVVDATAATDTTSALTEKGVVHLLAGPSVTLGIGKRSAKLPKTVTKRIDELAKLILDAKTVSCTAFSDNGTGDLALTKKQAEAACARLVKDGIKAKITTSGKGHAKPVASNKNKPGRALNRRLVVKFTL